MNNFVDFIWSRFTTYYNQNDTLKDNTGKGIFQRYLSVFGFELDEQVIPGIEGFIDNLNPETAADELLNNISYSLGQPDDILGDIEKYRKLLISIIALYQIKGTFRSYQMLFGLLGMTVSITEKFPEPNTYDSGRIYDDVTIYDDDACTKNCIHYDLCYDNSAGNTIAPLTLDMQAKLRSLITSLIEPHSAELDNLTYGVGCGAAPWPLIVHNQGDFAIDNVGGTPLAPGQSRVLNISATTTEMLSSLMVFSIFDQFFISFNTPLTLPPVPPPDPFTGQSLNDQFAVIPASFMKSNGFTDFYLYGEPIPRSLKYSNDGITGLYGTPFNPFPGPLFNTSDYISVVTWIDGVLPSDPAIQYNSSIYSFDQVNPSPQSGTLGVYLPPNTSFGVGQSVIIYAGVNSPLNSKASVYWNAYCKSNIIYVKVNGVKVKVEDINNSRYFVAEFNTTPPGLVPIVRVKRNDHVRIQFWDNASEEPDNDVTYPQYGFILNIINCVLYDQVLGATNIGLTYLDGTTPSEDILGTNGFRDLFNSIQYLFESLTLQELTDGVESNLLGSSPNQVPIKYSLVKTLSDGSLSAPIEVIKDPGEVYTLNDPTILQYGIATVRILTPKLIYLEGLLNGEYAVSDNTKGDLILVNVINEVDNDDLTPILAIHHLGPPTLDSGLGGGFHNVDSGFPLPHAPLPRTILNWHKTYKVHVQCMCTVNHVIITINGVDYPMFGYNNANPSDPSYNPALTGDLITGIPAGTDITISVTDI